MKKIVFVASVSLFLIIAAFVLTKQDAMCKGDSYEKIAPEFSLKDMSGAERKLSDFKDKVVIIDFWATWCPPCRQEIPHFIDLYNRYKAEGLEIIGISMDTNPGKTLPAFVEEKGINYPILLGNDKVYNLYGGIAAIPTTFIIDKEGKIRKKYIGYTEKEVFEKDIKELL